VCKEVVEKPGFGDVDVFGGVESNAFPEERCFRAKKCNSRAQLDGAWCIINRAREPKMEIPDNVSTVKEIGRQFTLFLERAVAPERR